MEGERNFDPEAMAMPSPERRDAVNPVPESEVVIEFARSSGPGGQNVNKLNTKAVLHWNVGRSSVFSEEEKAAIRAYAGKKRLNNEDEIVLQGQETRSQPQNKIAVVERLQALVCEALTPEKDRIPTKPKRSAKERRLGDKAHQSRKKAMRKPENW